MIKFPIITVIIIVGLIVNLPLRALNSPDNTNYSIMARSVYSIVELETSNVSTVSTDNENKFTIYISEGILYIKYSRPQDLVNGEAIVYNLLGQEITRKKLDNNSINQVTIPMQNTCYIVRINYSGKVYTQKVIASAQ